MTDFAWTCFMRGLTIGFGVGVMITAILYMTGEQEEKKKKQEDKKKKGESK